MSIALIPVARVILGVDESIQIAFITLCMWLIAGLMAGLTGMILFVRREAAIPLSHTGAEQDKPLANVGSAKTKLYASGLLLYTCLPFANFVVGYLLWSRYRQQSQELDKVGKDYLNFQITVYLYLLLSLFLVFIAVGVISNFLILVFHFIVTSLSVAQANSDQAFRFPANISIVK